MTAQEIIDYYLHAYKALWGREAIRMHSSGASHAPFEGYDPESIEKVCYGAEVRRIVREVGARSIEGLVKTDLDAPVKITKGSKQERGTLGVVVHALDREMGEGKALVVYDLYNNKEIICSERSAKLRPYLTGELDLLEHTYKGCIERQSLFPQGTRVRLINDEENEIMGLGVVMVTPMKKPNYNGNGFYGTMVRWQDGVTDQRILTEIRRVDP